MSWLDSNDYMIELNEEGDTILVLYQFTDLLVTNVSIDDLKSDGGNQKIQIARDIVKEHFSELLL